MCLLQRILVRKRQREGATSRWDRPGGHRSSSCCPHPRLWRRESRPARNRQLLIATTPSDSGVWPFGRLPPCPKEIRRPPGGVLLEVQPAHVREEEACGGGEGEGGTTDTLGGCTSLGVVRVGVSLALRGLRNARHIKMSARLLASQTGGLGDGAPIEGHLWRSMMMGKRGPGLGVKLAPACC